MPDDTERMNWLNEQGYVECTLRRRRSVLLSWGPSPADAQSTINETLRDAIDFAMHPESEEE